MSSIEGLEIRAFRRDDVDGWARTDLQRRHLIDGLENSGGYLAAVLPTGRVVGKIGIRYDEQPGAGTVLQFDVVEEFRDQGIGTALLRRAEQVIRDHGCDRVTLGVEETNTDAIRLYRRLGYREFGTEVSEWDQEAPDGTTYRYRCLCLLMCRTLSGTPSPP
ncbi:GNAT family N-acetyltransferase [Microlunatus parietis]|uniref:Ribosomal protein S18 acetylase RimI-like enzyme n=1 Tax=Microlunatus parietis TaxID=682979 RepID=A0A7Y9LC42_9ACTN|nr:GNAT family N-acetyltransferase [Microlunatus parietis]NYE71325.1 ribosomal protein S18 acetylase RimI-like enzyme [Microlunatus parietis]